MLTIIALVIAVLALLTAAFALLNSGGGNREGRRPLA